MNDLGNVFADKLFRPLRPQELHAERIDKHDSDLTMNQDCVSASTSFRNLSSLCASCLSTVVSCLVRSITRRSSSSLSARLSKA